MKGFALPSLCVLTANAQEQGEVGIFALSPLSDDAVDRLQILQTTGQLAVQLLGQAGCLDRQRLGRELCLPEPFLKGQVLLNEVLVLQGKLSKWTQQVSGHSGQN